MNIHLHTSLITYDYLLRINCLKWDYRVKESIIFKKIFLVYGANCSLESVFPV